MKYKVMKNIHILPTDKPSRLHLIKDNLTITSEYKNSVCDTEVNIYITSDEDINDSDYVITKYGRLVQVSYLMSKDLESASNPVVLTTEGDLIKYGVQAIDDEFLEWFVKNPSCEEVEVIKGFADSTSYGFNFLDYKIIIPKEEPKQLTDLEIAIKLEEIQREELKQEALEEVAEIGEFAEKKYLERLNNFQKVDFKDGVFEGAKWMQERMYSEDDLIKAYFAGVKSTGEGWNGEYAEGNDPIIEEVFKEGFENWFEPFKNK